MLLSHFVSVYELRCELFIIVISAGKRNANGSEYSGKWKMYISYHSVAMKNQRQVSKPKAINLAGCIDWRAREIHGKS